MVDMTINWNFEAKKRWKKSSKNFKVLITANNNCFRGGFAVRTMKLKLQGFSLA